MFGGVRAFGGLNCHVPNERDPLVVDFDLNIVLLEQFNYIGNDLLVCVDFHSI